MAQREVPQPEAPNVSSITLKPSIQMSLPPVFKAFQMYLNWISSFIYQSKRAEFGKWPDLHKPLMASQETDQPKP